MNTNVISATRNGGININISTPSSKNYVSNFLSLKKENLVVSLDAIKEMIDRIPGISETLQTYYVKVNSLLNSIRKIKELSENGDIITINRCDRFGTHRWGYDHIEIKVNGKTEFVYAIEDNEFEYFKPLFAPSDMKNLVLKKDEIEDFIEIFHLTENRDMSIETATLAIAAA